MDYGNRSKVPVEKLKEIPSCLRELPFQVGAMLFAAAFSCLVWQIEIYFKS